MIIFAEPVSRFIERRPTVKILALSFLILIGVLPFWDRLRQVAQVRRALRGINAAVVGIIKHHQRRLVCGFTFRDIETSRCNPARPSLGPVSPPRRNC